METFSASSIDKDSDRALVAAAKRGHVQAFEQLVLHHQHRVLALAQRITKNREDAEDVSQESFQKAFLHLHGSSARWFAPGHVAQVPHSGA
jgi:DNA-directed RNA polymerase specialized sigma24 family protein